MLTQTKYFFLIAVAMATIQVNGLMAQTTQLRTDQQAQAVSTPVPVQSVVFLAPANSRVSFVGVHVGDEPKPRLGGFKEFQGYVFVSPNDTITSFVLDINVASVWTQFQKLTGHLKAADFFETDKFPAARFVSTGIKTGAQGQCQITGNLTLHGQTKSISFPAQYRFENGGLLLATKFKLDRSQFGMNQMLSGVDKLVEVELYIGQPTRPAVEQPGHGSNEKKKPIQADADKETQHVSIDLPNMT